MESLGTYDELIHTIFNKEISNVPLECDLKYRELEMNKSRYSSWRIKKMIINLIKLLYANNNLFFGDCLKGYESEIIQYMIKCYKSALFVLEFEEFLKNIEKYGVILKILSNEKISTSEYIYDFFFVLKKENEIRTTLNKYFSKFSLTSIHYDITINELIECINNSECLSDNKCDYNKLSTFIFNLSEKSKQNNNGEPESTKINKERKKRKKRSKHKIKENPKEYSKDSKNFQDNIDSATFNSDTSLTYLKSNENLKNEEENISNLGIDNNTERNENNVNDINEINKINNNELIQQQQYTKYMDYFRKRKEFYNSKNIETPILDKIINEEIQINFDLFILKEGDPAMFDQHYKNLKRIVEKIFNDKNKACEEISKETIGYFTHTFFSKKFEGIYATIPNDLLFEEIINKSKLKSENFLKKNDDISDNCFKARGLSFEYYINDLLIKTFRFEDLPRVIFCFKPLDNSIDIKDIVELDSIFYSKNKEILNIKNLPFLDDDIIKRNKESYSLQNKIKFKFEAGVKDEITFDKNSLNLFEIKNRFPNNDPNDKRYLKTEVCSLLEKVIIFHELYKERFGSFDKVKVIFFYDSVRKEGYDNILLSKIEKFINSNKFLADKFEFQIIFIATSFLAFGIKSLSDRVENLETNITQNNIIINGLNEGLNDLKVRVEKLSKENQELRDEIDLLKKDRVDKGELSHLKHEMEDPSNDQ